MSVALIAVGLFYFSKSAQEPLPEAKNGDLSVIEEESEELGGVEDIKMIGERVISYDYTDDNIGEDLIIKTDRGSYAGLGNAYINFSITNTSLQSQSIKIAVPLLENEIRKVESIKRFIGNEIIFTPTSTIIVPPTTTTTEQQIVIPNKTKSQAVWSNLISSETTYSVVNKKDTKGAAAKNYFVDFLNKGETAYYELVLNYGSAKVTNEEFFIEVFGDKNSYGLLDPVITTIENFNTLNEGELDGQNGWVQSDTLVVRVGSSSGLDMEGAKVVSSTDNSAVAGWNYSKTITARTDGFLSVKMRQSGSAGANFNLLEGATNVGGIRFATNNRINMRDDQVDGDTLLLDPYAANTTYTIDIGLDAAGDKIRARINAGTWSDWKTSQNAYTQVDKIQMQGGGDNTGSISYYDYIIHNDGAVDAQPKRGEIIIFE